MAWFSDAVYNSFMPALSLMLVGHGLVDHQHEGALLQRRRGGNTVNYGRMKGLTEATIGYPLCVPQLDPVAGDRAALLHIGARSAARLMCEIIFGYPGVGQMVNTAINNSDYNLLTGVIFISIFAVATRRC